MNYSRNIVSGLVLCASLFSLPVDAFELVYETASKREFSRPHDIILSPDGKYLYVADNGNDRIVVLEPYSLRKIGSFGNGEVTAPHDVAFDANGSLLVADTGGNRIAVYSVVGASGMLEKSLTASVSRPEGVTYHTNGRIYSTGSNYGNVIALENDQKTRELDGLSSPHDIAVGPDDTLWVVDSGNDRLLNLDQDLKLIRKVEGEAYSFSGPRYLDFDDQGRLYVTDKYNHQVKVLAADMTMVYVLGVRHSTFGPGHFNRPEGVVIKGKDAWFSDTYNDRVVRYRIVD
jgi:DNA-binding beta-propeller fold protein YncE